MSAMQDPAFLDEAPEPRVPQPDGMGNKNDFKLSEAMLNKKHLNKTREDVKKIKKLMMEM